MEEKYKVPRAIILAQALQESGGGESKLAQMANNLFGVKCFQKNCPKGHCVNYKDDVAWDRFRCYASVRESFESHSRLLSGKRYGVLKRHGMDYVKWAKGLKRLGYATDRGYAAKLINLIETYNLCQ